MESQKELKYLFPKIGSDMVSKMERSERIMVAYKNTEVPCDARVHSRAKELLKIAIENGEMKNVMTIIRRRPELLR